MGLSSGNSFVEREVKKGEMKEGVIKRFVYLGFFEIVFNKCLFWLKLVWDGFLLFVSEVILIKIMILVFWVIVFSIAGCFFVSFIFIVLWSLGK